MPTLLNGVRARGADLRVSVGDVVASWTNAVLAQQQVVCRFTRTASVVGGPWSACVPSPLRDLVCPLGAAPRRRRS